MSIQDETWDRPICEFCNKEIPYGQNSLHRTGKCATANPPKRAMGDKKRFHYRIYGSERGQKYEIYTMGLNQWAECDDEERAKTICEALEKYFDHD